MDLEIEFFETASGQSPIKKHLKKLENERVELILSAIERLSKLRPKNMQPKEIGRMQGISYLRLKDKKGIHRVFFSIEGDEVLLLLHAFAKKDSEIKDAHVEKAKDRLKIWRQQNEQI